MKDAKIRTERPIRARKGGRGCANDYTNGTPGEISSLFFAIRYACFALTRKFFLHFQFTQFFR